MPKENSEFNPVITDSEIGNNGVGSSTANKAEGGKIPSADLEKLVLEQQATIERLQREAKLNAEKPNTADSVNTLAVALADAIKSVKAPAGPTEAENINRSTGFKERAMMDGAGMMEAQKNLAIFKDEPTVPISIPKSMAAYIGPFIAMTINGVRVSVPCDGRTYYINTTHAEHIKERLAKIDTIVSDTEPQTTEIG